RWGDPGGQAAVAEQVGVGRDSDAGHGWWKEPALDAPRDVRARDRPAERAISHARRTDAHGEGAGSCSRTGGILQRCGSSMNDSIMAARNSRAPGGPVTSRVIGPPAGSTAS